MSHLVWDLDKICFILSHKKRQSDESQRVSLFLSVSEFFCFCVSAFVTVSGWPFVDVSVSVSLCLYETFCECGLVSLCLSISFGNCLSIILPVCVCVTVSGCGSVAVFESVTVCISAFISVWLLHLDRSFYFSSNLTLGIKYIVPGLTKMTRI